MDPLAAAAALSVMVVVLLLAAALYQSGALAAPRLARHRLDALFSPLDPTRPASGGSALRQEHLSALPGLGTLLSGKEWAQQTALDLDRADLRLRVGEYFAMRVGLGLVLVVAVFAFIGVQAVAFVVGLVLGVVGYKVPALWVNQRKKKRIDKLNNQLEETLTLASNSLKAGFGLLQSLEMAADQMEHPMSTELRRTLRDINVGASTEDALLALSERAGSYDLDIVITAIMIQRSVGGNLAEILDTVAYTMRDRARIRGEIKTLTAQQRLTGYVLGGLPLFIMAILLVTAGDYLYPLFTTLGGQVMLAGATLMEVIGVLLIRRILAIEV